MAKEDKLRQYYIDPLSEKLGTPVEACGVYSRPGAASAAVSFAFSDGVGMFADSEGKKASGGLPMNVLLALTAAELVVFEMKAGMTGKLKLKDPLRRFPRNRSRPRSPGRARWAPGCASRPAKAASSSTRTSCRAWTSNGTSRWFARSRDDPRVRNRRRPRRRCRPRLRRLRWDSRPHHHRRLPNLRLRAVRPGQVARTVSRSSRTGSGPPPRAPRPRGPTSRGTARGRRARRAPRPEAHRTAGSCRP